MTSFCAYRHHDAWHIDQLEKKIASFGFELFRDTNFPNAYHQSAAQTMRPRPALDVTFDVVMVEVNMAWPAPGFLAR